MQEKTTKTLNNEQKYKYIVLEPMEWRNRQFLKDQIIVDTHNSYIRAMIHQNKLKKIN